MKKKKSKKIIKKVFVSSTIFFGCLSLILFKQVQADPSTGCGSLRNNTIVSNSITASDTCVELNVTAGGIEFTKIPDNLSFPSKYSSSYDQDVFSSDDPNTPALDATVKLGNFFAVSDTRYDGGFSVDLAVDNSINNGDLSNGSSTIPLRDILINTEITDGSIVPSQGTIHNGIWYEHDSKGTQDIASLYHSNATDLNLSSSYQTSFDDNHDNNPDTVILMSTSTPHLGLFGTGLNFDVKIPGSQASGSYDMRLVMTLITR